jgi:5-amino-6-(5-phosphoribosylamino)uracil reductase
MDLWRIYPGGETLTAAVAVSGLRLGELAPPRRPYLVANFVASADGKATFEGRSGKLGGEADKALFHRLRTQCDAVLVGSGTLRVERYGRLVRDPELRAAREAEGLAPDPVACVVSRSLSLPVDIPLLQDPEQRTLVFTASDERLEGAGPGVVIERVRAEELTLTTVLEVLHDRYLVRSVLCEGGPTLMGALLGEELVDELFLSVAPRIAGGGEAATIVEGMPLADLVELELVWVLESRGELFLRYRLVNPPAAPAASA